MRSQRALSYFSSRGTTQMFCATVMFGNRPICWMTYPMWRRSSTLSMEAASFPSMRTLPPSGSSRRLIIFIVVVFPQPDGPISTRNCPSGMVKLRSLRMVVFP